MTDFDPISIFRGLRSQKSLDQEQYELERTEMLQAMTKEEFLTNIEYVISHCSFMPHEPVYDNMLRHVYLPEMIRRMKEMTK